MCCLSLVIMMAYELLVVMLNIVFVFFFKQKTAYEIQYGLVGSEMCIRDRSGLTGEPVPSNPGCVNCGNDNTPDNGLVISYGSVTELTDAAFTSFISNDLSMVMFYTCLLYTSDAAAERSSVDLGGRRTLKKKQNKKKKQKN